MKFGYTILYVKDPEATLGFYERAFGQKRRMYHESGYGELDTGATTLAFASLGLAESHGFAVRPPSSEGPAAGFEVAFVTDDVAESWRAALAAGATPLSEPETKPWGQVVCYVKDPDGNTVEICSPVG